MKKSLVLFALGLSFFAVTISAQPRPPIKIETKDSAQQKPVQPALSSVEVRYEGGLFGYSDKEKGTIKFDDDNKKLVFYNEDNKERFEIKYDSILTLFPSSKKIQSGAGRTIGAIPLPGAGLGGSLLNKKKNYMILRFEDPDFDTRGTMSFLVDTNDLLKSAIQSLGTRAEMKPRGDAFYRPNPADDF